MDGAIIYNNAFYRESAASGRIYECYSDPVVNGLAFVQNVVECATNGSQQLIAVSGQTATNDPVNNVMFWHNTILGRGSDLAFNNVGSNSVQRFFWSLKNNLMDKLNIKTDISTTPSGNRTGDWSEVFGVGYTGNFNANTLNVGASGSFNLEFIGLSSYQPSGAATSSNTFFQFLNREAFDGVVDQAGNGDYHLQTNSPVFGLKYEWILPFDLDGNPRAAGSAAGVYASGSPTPAIKPPSGLRIAPTQ